MSGWFIELEFTGPLEPDQMEQAAEGAPFAHYTAGVQVLRLRGPLDAVEYDDAVREAQDWPVRLTGAAELVRAGVLSGPERMVIETSAARARMWDLLGAAEIAERLGVTTARVRQLEQRPDFPKPALTLAGGRIYRADDIDAFNRGWDRTPGRPRRADN
ncbi:helix-turn-helix transcriptional regulator [Phytohabitans houttuyneae]|uniref:Helix-turn-helix domain-containing protein n=1 Tax=Phytohabitans houttuyneae TaxID=1076126 RepID=A0A6V8KAP9_9ACTN|nr:hypothetical protein [Phytohabitans houttuyneae]GFJ79458.1 hypothetical protein Phou_036380 [Phytohabitans houttuyneae]